MGRWRRGLRGLPWPGLPHIRAVERVGVEAYRAGLAAGTKSPTIWDGKRGDPRHRLDACGQCHNFHTESACTWFPGPEGFHREPIRLELTLEDDPGLFQHYADGSPKSPCVLIKMFRTSSMHAAGVGCMDCHDPHGTEHWASLVLPIENNALCIKCHDEYESVAAQTAHSHHAAGSRGNWCVECHMPRHLAFTNGEQMMSKRLYSHTFDVPTGVRAEGGPPSSCNVCHKDRDHAWTRQILADWAAEK